MVDDRTQRPFGANDPAVRSTQAKPGGSDPLAELARLIGQNDPFGEFGREGARRASAPPAHQPPQTWDDEPEQFTPPPAAPVAPAPNAANYYTTPAPSVLPPNFARQSFGGAPLGNDADMYQVDGAVPGYAPQPVPGYEQPPFAQGAPHGGVPEEDYYEDEQPSRRRMGIVVIAGIFALAVIGTAGAFGYRAIFGSSSVSGPPPVIKADATPSKVVPAATKDPQSGKQITDRINDKGMGEKLVSREEQPVAVNPQSDATPTSAMPQSQSPTPPTGNGVVGAEPKKVRTIAIRPDQGTTPFDAPPQQPAPAAAQAPVRVIPTAKPAQPTRAAANNPPPAASADADADAASRPALPPRAQPAPAPRVTNAPLSLSPDASPRAAARPVAPAPVARTAAVAPAPAASGGGGGSYLVQVSSQRSEAEAQSAFASLQAKYPGQLGGKQAVIRKVDINGKGTYYRAMVSAGGSSEANDLCGGIKAAGGSCLVQKN